MQTLTKANPIALELADVVGESEMDLLDTIIQSSDPLAILAETYHHLTGRWRDRVMRDAPRGVEIIIPPQRPDDRPAQSKAVIPDNVIPKKALATGKSISKPKRRHEDYPYDWIDGIIVMACAKGLKNISARELLIPYSQGLPHIDHRLILRTGQYLIDISQNPLEDPASGKLTNVVVESISVDKKIEQRNKRKSSRFFSFGFQSSIDHTPTSGRTVVEIPQKKASIAPSRVREGQRRQQEIRSGSRDGVTTTPQRRASIASGHLYGVNCMPQEKVAQFLSESCTYFGGEISEKTIEQMWKATSLANQYSKKRFGCLCALSKAMRSYARQGKPLYGYNITFHEDPSRPSRSTYDVRPASA